MLLILRSIRVRSFTTGGPSRLTLMSNPYCVRSSAAHVSAKGVESFQNRGKLHRIHRLDRVAIKTSHQDLNLILDTPISGQRDQEHTAIPAWRIDCTRRS